jgi:hypothetical protein
MNFGPWLSPSCCNQLCCSSEYGVFVSKGQIVETQNSEETKLGVDANVVPQELVR